MFSMITCILIEKDFQPVITLHHLVIYFASFHVGVDISPFIDHLPAAANIDPRSFSSSSASGSTSMAANVIESMEFSPELFLLDEDTCARFVHEMLSKFCRYCSIFLLLPSFSQVGVCFYFGFQQFYDTRQSHAVHDCQRAHHALYL